MYVQGGKQWQEVNRTSLNLPRKILFYSQQRFRAARVLIEPLHSSLNENSCKQCPMYIASGTAKQSNEKTFLCFIYLLEAKEKCQNSALEQITAFHILYPRQQLLFFPNLRVVFVHIYVSVFLYILFVYFFCFLKLSLLFRSGSEGKKLRWNHNMFSFSCNKQLFFSQASAGTKYQIWLETINYNILLRRAGKKTNVFVTCKKKRNSSFIFNSMLSHNLFL